VELDSDLYAKTLETLSERYGELPKNHNLSCNDFFLEDYPPGAFDIVIGNPPFGGTFNHEIEDKLDAQYGRWNGYNDQKGDILILYCEIT
jgi:hypothetical protein